MQYRAPKIIHTRGFVKIRYRTTFMLMGVMCLYYYEKTSYLSLTTYISDVISDKAKIRLERHGISPYKYIGIVAHLAPQIVAGRFAETFTSKWIIFASILMLAICMFMMPKAVNKLESTVYLDVINVIMKFSHGLVPPAAQVMITRWGPPNERFVMGSLIYSCYPLGQSLAVFITTWVSVTIGWEYTFYFSAAMNVFWLFGWVWWSRDDPCEHEQIGEEEKQYIMDSLKDQLYQYRRRLESRAPWREILRSGPVWAALIVNVQFYFGNYMYHEVMTKQTVEFRSNNVMHPLNQAVVLAMPYIWLAVIIWFFGLIFHNLVLNGMTKVRAYRIGTFIFLLGSALNVVSFYCYDNIKPYNREVTSVLLLFLAGYLSTVPVMFSDIAPNYAGTLAGFCSIVARIPTHALNLLQTYDKEAHQFVMACCNVGAVILTALVSLVYCSGDVQPWNNHCHLLEADDVYLHYDL